MGLTVISSLMPDNTQSVVLGSTRQATKCVMGYTLTLDYVKWRLERGNLVQQTDGFNCRPIACLKILELFSWVTTQDDRLAYSTNSIRHMVVEQWQLLLSACNHDLLVRVCEHLLLLEPHPEEGDIVDVPAKNTQINPLVNSLVAAAAATLAKSPIASMDICFCCADEPTMELIVLVRCKKTLHKQCVLASLGMSSQCVYCRAVLDIAKVLDYPVIDRSVGLSSASVLFSPPNRKSPTKW